MRRSAKKDTLTLSAATQTTPFRIDHFKGLSVQIKIAAAGTAVGTMVVQVSNDTGTADNVNDVSPNSTSPVYADLSWTDVGGTTASISATTGSPFFINVPNLYGRWACVSYTHTSGSSTATVWTNGKGES